MRQDGESRDHHAERKKPVTKDRLWFDCIYAKCAEEANLGKQEPLVVTWLGFIKGAGRTAWYRVALWSIENVLKSIMVMAAEHVNILKKTIQLYT